jgi:ABC-type branched-subunit amino acid transport system substrate-binding protein
MNARLPVIRQLQRTVHLGATLDVWELKGPVETWKAQLESFYRTEPVFALLGGISSGAWAPVHEFCEENKIPCILPLTELPVISEDDWYTLYFSRGYYQEGESAAKYLARVLDLPEDKRIVQVFHDNGAGRALAEGFADVWKKLGRASLKNRVIPAGQKTAPDFLRDISAAEADSVLLLWLGPEDLAGAGELAQAKGKPSLIFVSGGMLGDSLPLLPDIIRDFTLITYPKRLPDEGAQIRTIVDRWLQVRNIPVTDKTILQKMYFLTRMVSNALSEMRGNIYRDYFLDLFDVNLDQTNTAAAYPRLSFGPGQRYASKGCYIVKLSQGAEPRMIRLSEWIIY